MKTALILGARPGIWDERFRGARGKLLKTEAITADLADATVCLDAVDRATSAFGRLDLS